MKYDCLYCKEEQYVAPFFLSALGNKPFIVVCGTCSLTPLTQRPNYVEAEQQRKRTLDGWRVEYAQSN